MMDNTPGQYNKSILKKKDLASFSRKLTAFFHNKNKQKQETELANKEPSIKSKTIRNPKRTIIDTFIKVVN